MNCAALLRMIEAAYCSEFYVDFVTKRTSHQHGEERRYIVPLVDLLGKGTTPLQRIEYFDAATLRSIVRESGHLLTILRRASTSVAYAAIDRHGERLARPLADRRGSMIAAPTHRRTRRA